MTARGASRDEDGGRVGAVLVAVLAYPGDDLLHVDERSGEPRRRKQAVVRADAHPALARKPVEQGTCPESLAAEAERSPMEVNQGWASRRMGAMAVEVEQVSPACGAVADVRDPLDSVAPKDRREQDAAQGGSTAEPSGELGVHAVLPAGPEALVQGTLERRAGPSRPPVENHEPGRRQDGQTEPDPENGRANAALGDRQRRRGDEQGEGDERPVDQEAEEKTQ